MKIFNWNCNGALRKKLDVISAHDADIYIIQECEDPAKSKDNLYKKWAGEYLWSGINKNKGIGVFAKNGYVLNELPIDAGRLESFIPFKVNGVFTFLAVWTREANSPTFKYIGQLWKYLQLHKFKLESKNTIIIGDLNSNARWDVWDRWWNHSDVVRALEEIEVYSLYHHIHKENQGNESIPTFYLQRNIQKPYHIDYAFLSEELLEQTNIEIGNKDNWLQYSDHMPIILTIK